MSEQDIVFDFADILSVWESMSKYFGIDKKDIKKFKSMYIEYNDGMYIEFIRHFNIDESKLRNEDVFLVAKHITTIIDNKESLKKYGFINLKDIIEKDTPMRRFLNKNGIELNIDNKEIIVDGIRYEIKKDDEELSIQSEFLYDRVYEHNCEREVFLGNIVSNYSTIERYPEILETIHQFCKDKANRLKYLGYEWSKLSEGKTYVLEFDIGIKYLNTKSKLGYFEDEYLELWGYNSNEESIPKTLWDGLFLFKNCMKALDNGKVAIYGEIYNNAVINYEDIYAYKYN